MKKTTLLSLVTLASMAASSQASILVTTGFEGYSGTGGSPAAADLIGNAAPQTGDIGLSGTWTGSANWDIGTSGLSYSGASNPSGTTRVANYTGSTFQIRGAGVAINTPITGQNVYIRMLLSGPTADANNHVTQIQLNNLINTGNNGYQPGFGFATTTTASDNEFFVGNVANGNSGTITRFGGGLAANTSYMMIGKLTWDSINSEFSQLDVKLNPTNGTEPGVWDASLSFAALNITSLSTLSINGGGTAGGSSGQKIDGLVFATSYGEGFSGVAVPEPNASALFAGALTALLVFRRRRVL